MVITVFASIYEKFHQKGDFSLCPFEASKASLYCIFFWVFAHATISLDETKNLLQFCEKEDFSVKDYDIALVVICDVNSQYDWKVHILYNQCLNGTFP